MKPFCLVLVPMLACLSHASIRVRDCVVVVDPKASAQERFAAQELRDHLSKIVGVKVPLRESRQVPVNAILVGSGRLAQKLAPGAGWGALRARRTGIVCSGDRMVVSGGAPRGVMYAVYRLLQMKCGVRWWAPWATRIPRNPGLTFSQMNWTEKPAFEYRDSFWHHSFDANWAARNFDNGANTGVDAKRGGKTVFEGWAHTYYQLVPPAEYFRVHPEWYSLIDGKRTTENAQLCTTNPQLRDFVVEEIRKRLRANPKATIVSVSQNDCYGPCQCPVCRALAAREGSDAALVLDLANYVADHIRGEFPHVTVETLAYQWSRHPVRTMRPRSNVIVQLCSIECDFAHPLYAKPNQAFADDLTGWHKLTNRLYVWDYCTNFLSYLQPQPDYFSVGPTLKWFAKTGVKGVFEEGAYSSNGGDMAELKAWVIAQMLWDPTQDPNALINEFLAGYYGPAAKPIRKYLDLVSAAANPVRANFQMDESAAYVAYPVMKRAMAFWGQALKATVNTEYEPRVRRSMLSPQLVWLVKWDGFAASAKAAGDPWPWLSDKNAAADEWLRTATTAFPGYEPLTSVNEQGLTPQRFVNMIKSGELKR